MKIIDIIGWLGVGLILGAYALISLQILEADSLVYIFMNIFGSAGIITSSYSKKDSQPIVLNIVWIVIALIALVKMFI